MQQNKVTIVIAAYAAIKYKLYPDVLCPSRNLSGTLLCHTAELLLRPPCARPACARPTICGLSLILSLN